MSTGDDVNKLPTDKSEVPKSQLEMMELLFKNNEASMKTFAEGLKTPLIATFIFFILNTQFIDSLIRKLAGPSEYTLVWKSIVFFVLFLIFRK